MANECIPFYERGDRVTGHATAAVVGKRFVAISGNRTGGNIAVATATAAGVAFGVAQADAAVGQKVGVLRDAGMIVPVTAEVALTAGQEVEVGTAGQARLLATGKARGYVVTAAAAGADAQVSLYA